jgi:protein CpxP
MTENLRIIPIVGALLIAGLVLSVSAHAQSPSTPAPAPPPTQTAPSPANPAMDDAIGKRITQLHAALQITADEEAQWRQFADVMRDNAHKMDQTYKDRAAKFANLSALENMQSYAQIAQEHAEDVQRLGAAFQPLYAAMPDAQKKIADEVFRNAAAKRTQQK